MSITENYFIEKESWNSGGTETGYLVGRGVTQDLLYVTILELTAFTEYKLNDISSFKLEVATYPYSASSYVHQPEDITVLLVQGNDYTKYIKKVIYGNDVDPSEVVCKTVPTSINAPGVAYTPSGIENQHIAVEFSNLQLQEGNTYYVVLMPTSATAERGVNYVQYNYGRVYDIVTVQRAYTVTYDANGRPPEWMPAQQTKEHDVPLVLSDVSEAFRTYYEVEDISVKFDAMGGDYTGVDTLVELNHKYVFSHWEDAAGVMYDPGSNYTNNEDVTLFAVYEHNHNNIDCVSTAIQLPTATRTGYTLRGWAESETDALDGINLLLGTYAPVHDTTLYASWRPEGSGDSAPGLSTAGASAIYYIKTDGSWKRIIFI